MDIKNDVHNQARNLCSHRSSCSLIIALAHSLHSFPKIRKVTIVINKKNRALRHPYRTRAKTKIMSEIEEVQEQVKADLEAIKEKMMRMMEAMMDIRKIIEVNAAAASTATEGTQLTHPFLIKKVT